MRLSLEQIMDDVIDALRASGFKGELDTSAEAKEFYSHDASLFEIHPKLVASPIDSADVQTLVKVVNEHKKHHKDLSLTARSAGTDMSGGAINDSVIVDFNKHFTTIGKVTPTEATTQPGVFYRDFEVATFKHGALLPPYPASRQLCTVGGMVNNNSGGEKSLEFGKTEKFVKELKVIFGDGKEYVVKPLNKADLQKKMKQKDYEGRIYRQVFELVDKNYDKIKAAKPNVTKNSTGYNLWNIWDRETGIFDLTQAIIGAQGTLGFTTEAKFRLVKNPKHSGSLVMFLRSLDDLGDVINTVMQHHPATFEGFDNYTLMLSFKLFFYFRKTLGWGGMIKLGFQLLPDLLMFRRGIPKMVLLIEFTADTPAEVAGKVHQLRVDMRPYNHESLFEEDETEAKERKFWIMRRESFQLLRKKVKDKHTAPFIDDLVVNPPYLPQFLPELRVILKKYKFLATIAGHMGDGNFHIIPLMKLEDRKERAKLKPAMREVDELVLKYKGSLSGEHNDGLVRGPWLEEMYGRDIVKLFRELKDIFDPDHIFNPHKKANASWDYSFDHVRDHF